MIAGRILVAGIGNVFFGDDGFGGAVIDVLRQRVLPGGVRVKDFGIRGFDLASAMLDEQDAVILIDAASRGHAPGSLYVIDLDDRRLESAREGAMVVNGHCLDVSNVLRTVDALGSRARFIKLVGCEPVTFGPADEPLVGLSDPVKAAVVPAADLVESMLRGLTARVLPRGPHSPPEERGPCTS